MLKTVTLSTLENSSTQEVFDYIVSNLLSQSLQSIEINTGSCRYRGDNNLKCAVGFIISDDEYIMEFEGKTASELSPLKHSKHIDLLEALQTIHDSYDVFTWELKFMEIARLYKLKWQIGKLQ